MTDSQLPAKRSSSLRRRILAFVVALVLLTLMGSTLSLYRITEVNRLLDAINRVSVPLGRIFVQMQSDADVFGRELERGLGSSHWKDPHWHPRPIPRWIQDVLESEVERINLLVKTDVEWTNTDSRTRWEDWASDLSRGLVTLKSQADKLYLALDKKDEAQAAAIYPGWIAAMEEWRHQLQWGSTEYDRLLRQTFTLAETRVIELRTGLEAVLIVVVLLSMLLLWLGERALRPLGELTKLAREITRRGLKKEDKGLLPYMSLTRTDEVSQLAREFHHMATALLEREKMVESQKNRVQEQNRLLRDMGELNVNILNSIESVLIVTDLVGKVTQCNPIAKIWLETPEGKEVLGSCLWDWPKLQGFEKVFQTHETAKIEPIGIDGRVYGGHMMPLKSEKGDARGTVLVLHDLTDELDLQERLRRAENLAAIGRMSAQVAHEVRNPLHSIGLEAEMAAEAAAKIGNPFLKQSLQSILTAVDRLEKITENYLKLSKLSADKKGKVDLGEVLEKTLATYAPACENQGVTVDWKREPVSNLLIWGDSDLLEQVLGNLFRNALQALESKWDGKSVSPQISWSMGNAESGRVWIRIEDNGPGIAPVVRGKLFVPFVTTRAQGTGLGLSFVKQVLDEHGGSIQYLDRGEDAGTVFELAFPPLGQMPSEEVSEYAENSFSR